MNRTRMLIYAGGLSGGAVAALVGCGSGASTAPQVEADTGPVVSRAQRVVADGIEYAIGRGVIIETALVDGQAVAATLTESGDIRLPQTPDQGSLVELVVVHLSSRGPGDLGRAWLATIFVWEPGTSAMEVTWELQSYEPDQPGDGDGTLIGTVACVDFPAFVGEEERLALGCEPLPGSLWNKRPVTFVPIVEGEADARVEDNSLGAPPYHIVVEEGGIEAQHLVRIMARDLTLDAGSYQGVAVLHNTGDENALLAFQAGREDGGNWSNIQWLDVELLPGEARTVVLPFTVTATVTDAHLTLFAGDLLPGARVSVRSLWLEKAVPAGTGGPDDTLLSVDLIMPLHVATSVTQQFGSTEVKASGHLALDLAAAIGDRVDSPVGGTVVFAGQVNGYGSAAGAAGGVVLVQVAATEDHGAFVVLLGHLQNIAVTVDQHVSPGTQVGEIGPYPSTTGADWSHLHLGIRAGVYGTAGADFFKGYGTATETAAPAGAWHDPQTFLASRDVPPEPSVDPPQPEPDPDPQPQPDPDPEPEPDDPWEVLNGLSTTWVAESHCNVTGNDNDWDHAPQGSGLPTYCTNPETDQRGFYAYQIDQVGDVFRITDAYALERLVVVHDFSDTSTRLFPITHQTVEAARSLADFEVVETDLFVGTNPAIQDLGLSGIAQTYLSAKSSWLRGPAGETFPAEFEPEYGGVVFFAIDPTTP